MSKLLQKLSKVIPSNRQKKGDPSNESNTDESAGLETDAAPINATHKGSADQPQNKPVLVENNSLISANASSAVVTAADQIPTGPNLNQINAQSVLQFNNSSGIHIGNVNSYTLNQSQQTVNNSNNNPIGSSMKEEESRTRLNSGKRKVYPRTRTIDVLLKSERCIEHVEIDIIATHLGEDWRSVARDLGFSEGQIDQFHEDNVNYGVKEVIYQLITEWKERQEHPAVGKVCQILWKRDLHKEVVYLLKEDYKRRQQQQHASPSRDDA